MYALIIFVLVIPKQDLTPTEPDLTINLEVQSLSESNYRALASYFDKYVMAFGTIIVGTESVSDENLIHAGNIMCQYIDNDGDGEDDTGAATWLAKRNAVIIMAGSGDEMDEFGDIMWIHLELAGHFIMQDLYDDETHPDGLPYDSEADEFDASLEEVLHIITHAYSELWPEAFGFDTESDLAAAMDIARGGYFLEIPDEYPDDAWYSYYDDTCDYESCQTVEYFYWALTSLLGAQAGATRFEQI